MNNNARVRALRDYLLDIVKGIVDEEPDININMLYNDPNNYSLDKVPTSSTVEKWVTGTEIHKDLYSFRSRMDYSKDYETNLNNIDFFEKFENTIELKNKKKELPDIEGIESIECMNCGSMVNTTSNTAEFDIQIQIKYIINYKEVINETNNS